MGNDVVLNWQRDGVEIVSKVISPSEARSLRQEVANTSLTVPRHGIRHAEIHFAGVKTLSSRPSQMEKRAGYFSGSPTRVQAIFFDKFPGANWSVAWHQDRTIADNKKLDVAEWGPWSMKDGVHHVQPPVEVLNPMVTIRIHLDAANKTNGCLKVLPGSYKVGIIHSADLAGSHKRNNVVSCIVGVGDAVVMRPHTVHASSKSQHPRHRRVLHFEYACCELPTGLEWI